MVGPARAGRERPRRLLLPVALAGILGVAVVAAVRLLVPGPALANGAAHGQLDRQMREAARLMAEATAAVRAARLARGLEIDPVSDPNRTGLIGLEHSPITTTYGDLQAKRTTTNPNCAALLVRLLNEAGVRDGDWIAVGASSSFPALIVASLAAARAMGLEVRLVCSLTASMWGANDPDFTFLDMHAGFREVLPYGITAVSIGGELDAGRGVSPEGSAALRAAITSSGLPFIEAPDLAGNVRLRLALHRPPVPGALPAAFINVGGAEANLGRSTLVLTLRPGLLRTVRLPPPRERGVLHAMAAEGVPVIHLLNVKGLALRHGLPWDPMPLPGPGEGEVFRVADVGSARRVYALALAGYTAALVLLIVAFRKVAR